METIVTVNGRIAAEAVGVSAVGERLIADLAVPRPKRAADSWFFDQPVALPQLGDLMLGRANRDDARLEPKHAGTELARFAQAGGALVVDITTPAEGRDLAALRELGRESGVHVVVAAVACDDPDRIARALHDDGLGVILITADAGAVVRRAAGVAAARTGAPVLVDAVANDPEQALGEVLSGGVAPQRVALRGLTGAALDERVLRSLAAAGAVLVFDGLGRIPSVRTIVSDHEIAVAIAGLVAAGAEEQIVLGAGLSRKHAFTAFGGNGLRFLPEQFVPYLRMQGVDEDDVQRIASRNAVRWLSRTEAAA